MEQFLLYYSEFARYHLYSYLFKYVCVSRIILNAIWNVSILSAYFISPSFFALVTFWTMISQSLNDKTNEG